MSDETVVSTSVVTPVPVSTPLPIKDAGRDVLGDALKAPKQARYFDQRAGKFEQYQAVDVVPVAVNTSSEVPVVVSTSTESATPVSTSTAVVSTSTAVVTDPNKGGDKKLYAGKFETVEAMETAYAEAQKAFHTKSQELAEAKKQVPPPDPKVALEQNAERKAALLNKIIEDPEGFAADIKAQAQASIAEDKKFQSIRDDWAKENPDIADLEKYVGYEASRLVTLDPSLGADTAALLKQATTNFRQDYGKIRESGKLEALQVRSSVTPLSDSKIQTPPPSEQPQAAPKSEEQIRNEHIDFLKAQSARVRLPMAR